MIDIRVLASGSTGNCYLLDDGESPLLIEAGIRFPLIQQGVGFTIARLAGCLVSHSHADHCKAVKDLAHRGVDVYLSKETMATLGVFGHCYHVVEPRKLYRIGRWQVLPFETEHDAEGSLGFVIEHGTEKIVYLTDTCYSRYTFTGMTKLLIEANFDPEILRENVASGEVDRSLKRRVYGNHLSIDRVLDFLRANDLSKLQEVVLIHLSDSNSDAEEFKHRVAEVVGVPVFVA